MENGE
jgi:hypothetical protein